MSIHAETLRDHLNEEYGVDLTQEQCQEIYERIVMNIEQGSPNTKVSYEKAERIDIYKRATPSTGVYGPIAYMSSSNYFVLVGTIGIDLYTDKNLFVVQKNK